MDASHGFDFLLVDRRDAHSESIIASADAALDEPPLDVTRKGTPPPGGDFRDYDRFST